MDRIFISALSTEAVIGIYDWERGVKQRLEIVKALADPEVRAKYADQGLTIRGTTPEELGAATREQLARYGKLMKEAGIKAE